ncbi:MAG: hypothetical protein JKY65_06115 [Planctomycetes bacterium]|nr:hypothetical protein [Planctomycetota bacterium]
MVLLTALSTTALGVARYGDGLDLVPSSECGGWDTLGTGSVLVTQTDTLEWRLLHEFSADGLLTGSSWEEESSSSRSSTRLLEVSDESAILESQDPGGGCLVTEGQVSLRPEAASGQLVNEAENRQVTVPAGTFLCRYRWIRTDSFQDVETWTVPSLPIPIQTVVTWRTGAPGGVPSSRRTVLVSIDRRPAAD